MSTTPALREADRPELLDLTPALSAAYAALGDAEQVATEEAVVPVMAARNDVHRAVLATNRAVTLLSLAVHRPEQARLHARAALQALGRVVELPRSTFPDDDGQVLVVTPEPAEPEAGDRPYLDRVLELLVCARAEPAPAMARTILRETSAPLAGIAGRLVELASALTVAEQDGTPVDVRACLDLVGQVVDAADGRGGGTMTRLTITETTTGQVATVENYDVAETIRLWFPAPTPEVARAIEQLQTEVLRAGRTITPEVDGIARFLGLTIERADPATRL